MKKTKDRILEKALLLFNEKGLATITLRKIASELGMSQGNLNYHFKKREAIITELYFNLVDDMDNNLRAVFSQKINLNSYYQLTSTTIQYFYKYRFIFLDFTQIIRENDTIKKHYNQLLLAREQQAADFFKMLIHQQIIRPEAFSNEYANVYKRIQILSDFWISSQSIESTTIDITMKQKYAQLILETIYPYLLEKGINEYKAILKNNNTVTG